MKPSPRTTPYDTETMDWITAEAVASATELHRHLSPPNIGMREARIVWLQPEQAAPRALPGDDEPLPDDIEL